MKKQEKGEIPVLEEFEVFKKRGNLTHLCDNLLNMLNTPFEEPLAYEGELMRGTISFLKEKVEGERSLEGLEGLRGLLESEEKGVRALLEKNTSARQERKRAWIVRRRMDRLGVSEEEARRDLEEKESLFEEGLEGVYKIEREMERIERLKVECLRYMTLGDYNRLTMLFMGGSLPPADYLINFWRDERDILARYGELGQRELMRFYQTHKDSLVREQPQLRRAFMAHLWRVGLQSCPYCNLLISTAGAPFQFQCPRCGAVLRAAIPGV